MEVYEEQVCIQCWGRYSVGVNPVNIWAQISVGLWGIRSADICFKQIILIVAGTLTSSID